MSTSQLSRPNFFEGQYIGEDDLDLAVDYSRFHQARHALGAHTYGIVTGLELREEESPAGGVDVSIQPGLAVDGYGRHIVVSEPYKILPEYFASIARPLGAASSVVRVMVYIRFKGDATTSPAAGFKVCDAEDQSARLQEGFCVEVAAESDLDHEELHDPVIVAGQSLDALEAPPSRSATDPVHCDESVPYQTFPSTEEDPERKWLIPLGYVKWDAARKTPVASEEEEGDLRRSRSARRYVGTVAEEILAADGWIRLRRRETSAPEDSTDPLSSVCESQLLRIEEGKDLNDEGEVVDLAWVEGNLRVIGDAKLFGGQLEFRDHDGDPVDLFKIVRDSSGDLVRFASSAVDPILVMTRSSGLVGIGTEEPKTSLHIATGEPAELQDAASGYLVIGNTDKENLVLDSNEIMARNSDRKSTLHLQAEGGDLHIHTRKLPLHQVIVKDSGQVGIATTNPKTTLHLGAGDDATLTGDDSGYLLIGNTGSKNLVLDTNEIMARRGGSKATLRLQAEGGDVKVHHRKPASTQFIIKDSGDVGIGATSPQAKLDVRGDIKLGLAGEFYAVAGNEKLRVVVGRVSSNGTKVDGTGFTSAYRERGKYRVTFSNAFTSEPVVIVSLVDSPNNDNIATIHSLSSSAFDLYTTDVTGGGSPNFEDTAFTFIAMGPR